nr:MAG TPA: hypothetical protein [Caudoviricetes sp.]DAQ99440.1 MAG TPA: hypothetical protein [Caudoviricetes sp.]
MFFLILPCNFVWFFFKIGGKFSSTYRSNSSFGSVSPRL